MAWATSRWTPPPGWQRLRQDALTEHGRVCHLCHHDGSDTVDHVTPRSQDGTDDPTNLRPIHGRPCPTCGNRCHTIKTQAEALAARPTRRRATERHPGLL